MRVCPTRILNTFIFPLLNINVINKIDKIDNKAVLTDFCFNKQTVTSLCIAWASFF